MKAAAEAERLTVELKRPMRVLGWYHSHPHITVCPSHVGMYQNYFFSKYLSNINSIQKNSCYIHYFYFVDVRTQATYQTMDHSFVGLIFSVFSEGKESKVHILFWF